MHLYDRLNIEELRKIICEYFNGYNIKFYNDVVEASQVDHDGYSVSQFHNSFRYSVYFAGCATKSDSGDISFVLSKESRIIARIGLRVDNSKDNNKLFTFSDYVYLPDITQHCSDNDAKTIYENYIDLVFGKLKDWLSTEIKILIPDETKFTWFSNLLNKYSVQVQMISSMYNDLRLSSGSYTRRKSYKNLISYAAKNYHFKIITNKRQFIIDEYKDFHAEVAGRLTRERESWLEQEKWIRQGTAFISECRFNKALIGYSYMAISDEKALYFSGVYSRDRHYKGISHACLSRACSFAREINLYILDFGQMASLDEDKKLQNITQFKLGFTNSLRFNIAVSL